MKISVRVFTGMRPAISDDLLKPGEATVATDTLLTGGDVVPFNQPQQILALTSANPVASIYRYQADSSDNSGNEAQYWFQSQNDCNWVRGPVDQDTEYKTYGTGFAGYPVKTKNTVATASTPYPSTVYPLGLQQPSAMPTPTVTGTATDATSAAETVVYVTTLVTAWGEEGPPSAPSSPVSWRVGQSIVFSSAGSNPLPVSGVASYPGNTNKSQSYVSKNLYRSATGSSGTAKYLLVASGLSLATTDYTDTTLTVNLGAALQSRGWVEPPDGMLGLTQMANGILAGYVGSTVCFSEPFVPYAWPVRYQQSVDADVIGMAAFDQSLVVATRRSIYVFTGADPASITSERLATPHTCLSKRSMVEMMGGVVYASATGLVLINAAGVQPLTEPIFTRREWAKYSPSSIVAFETDGRYLAFYDNGTTKGGLLFRFGEDASFCTTSVHATAGFRDRARDALYLCVNGTGTTRNIVKWDAGSTQLSFTWTSSQFRLPSPANMGVARVDGSGTLNFELIADGVVRHGPVAITSASAFRLPADYRAQRYQFRVTGTGTLRAVELADSMRSMAENG